MSPPSASLRHSASGVRSSAPRGTRGWLRALLAAAALAFPWASLAHGPHHLVCPRSKLGGVKIDGDIRSWQPERFIAIPHTSTSFGDPRNDADSSFRFAVLWDALHLYIAVEVVDDSVVLAPTLERLYEGDCIEVALDVHNDSEGGYDAGDFQFVLSPSGPERKPRVNLYRNPVFEIDHAPFVTVGSNITTEGYVVEVAFAWRELGIAPKPGHVVGFEINIRDYDADGTRKGLTWAPAADPAANPLRWGDLLLVTDANDDVAPILDTLREKNARWQRLVAGTARETDNEVAVTIAPRPVGALALGVGWNVQFRDGRFPDWDEGAWSAFLELLAWTRPAWIRYGVNLGHWEPRNDDDDPSHPNWNAFAFRSKAMRHHYRVLDLCEKRGIDVLWANWAVGDPATAVNWLAESLHDDAKADTDNDPFNDAPYDPEELAESLAACLHRLKSVRGYTCVKQVSLWNEPNLTEAYNSPSAQYPDAFWGYYTVLARHLQRLGLRDSVRILGPETSTTGYATLPRLARSLTLHSREVDILAHHDYLGYADYHRIDRGVPMSQAAEAYAGLLRTRTRPVAVTEFGNMGNGGGEVTGEEAIWAGSLSACRLVIEGLNAGVAGFLRWEFKPYGVSWRNFGALTSQSQRHLFEPYRPVFFPHALLCHAATRGAQVLATTLRGGLDENRIRRVACAALQHRDTGTSLLLLNDGLQPKRVTIAFSRLFRGQAPRRFGHLSYDASLPATFQAHPDVVVAGGRATLTLPPQSLHALATRAEFAKPPPVPVLPPRDEPQYLSQKLGGQPRDLARMRFNTDYDWRVWQSTAGHTTFQTRPGRAEPANRVCRIAYEFVGVRQQERLEHVVAHTDLIVNGKPLDVAFRLYGDDQNHFITVIFLDAKGEVFELPERQPIDWAGWRRVEMSVESFPEGWNHWSGDAKPDYPLRGFGIVVTAPKTTYRGRGILEIDDVEVISQPPEPPK